jgi:hypothetical protein
LQIPQAVAAFAPRTPLVQEDDPPEILVVHSLARFWKTHGTDDGSRMT